MASLALIGLVFAQTTSGAPAVPPASAPAAPVSSASEAPASDAPTAPTAPATATSDAPLPPGPMPVPPPPVAPVFRDRPHVGVHLGLNATLTVDLAVGRYFYGGFATQLTGFGFFADTSRNYVLSALVFAGVALTLAETRNVRLTADLTPMVSYFHAAPVNMVNIGFLAGLRVVHASGFTAALRLPLVGYAGAPDARRGSLLYYYIGAIPTVPVLTLGYTF